MQGRRCVVLALGVVMVASMLAGTGCSYLGKRGQDALDMFDVGITFTNKLEPDFALYIDFFSLTPIGYSSVDGKILGTGNGQIGWLDYHDHCWGALVGGAERKGSGRFNPADPHQARPDQAGLTERPQFHTGIARLGDPETKPPKLQFFECDRILHLGWIGIHLSIRPLEIADFLLGWATLDTMGDDVAHAQGQY